MASDLDWLNATLALVVPPYKPAGFVALLRLDGPIPAGAREMLAEMLDPEAVGGYNGIKLRIEEVKSATMMDEGRKRIALEYLALFDQRAEQGDVSAAKTAAEEVGTRHGISARTVERFVHEVRELRDSVKEWISSPAKS